MSTSVYDDELKRMSQGEISLHSSGAMPKLITVFYQMDEKSIPNRELYAEALKRLNNSRQSRRLRIFAGNDTVPPVVWLVLLVGSVIQYFVHLFLRNEEHQGAIPDRNVTYGNDHVDFIFDLYP